MRTGQIYQSPWLALSFWPTLEVHIHVHMHKHIPEPNEGGHANAESFSNSKMSNAIFITHTAISEAILDRSFCIIEYRHVFTGIHTSKRLLEEIARERHHTIKTRENIYFWRAKIPLCLEMLISSDLKAQITTSHITVWLSYVCLYNDFVWQMVYNHVVIQS